MRIKTPGHIHFFGDYIALLLKYTIISISPSSTPLFFWILTENKTNKHFLLDLYSTEDDCSRTKVTEYKSP